MNTATLASLIVAASLAVIRLAPLAVPIERKLADLWAPLGRLADMTPGLIVFATALVQHVEGVTTGLSLIAAFVVSAAAVLPGMPAARHMFASSRVTLPLLCLVIAPTVSACGGYLENARGQAAIRVHLVASPPTPACQSLDANRRFWTGASALGLAMTGAAGLSTIPVTNETARAVVAGAAVAFVAGTAVAKVEGDNYTADWVAQCTDP